MLAKTANQILPFNFEKLQLTKRLLHICDFGQFLIVNIVIFIFIISRLSKVNDKKNNFLTK